MALPARKSNPVVEALRPASTPLLYAGLFSLVSNLLYIAFPIYTNQVFGRVLVSQSQATLLVLTVGIGFVFLVSGVIDALRSRVLTALGVGFDQRVAPQVFDALFDAAVRREPGAKTQALRDLDLFRGSVTGPAVGVLFDVPWIPIFLGVLFIIDPIIGMVTVAGGVVLLGLAFAQDRTNRSTVKRANDAALQSYTFTEAALRNGEVVRAMGMLPSLRTQWAVFRHNAVDSASTAADRSSGFAEAIKLVRMSVQILIIAVGALLVLRGDIGAGLLFANMILSARALAPIERAVGSWNALITARQAYDRLVALMADYDPPIAATDLPRPTGRLTVERVNFAAGGRLLLAGINFTVEPGQTVGIVGPSGAGKSTLVRLLVGVWRPVNGAVRLDGGDVFAWEREAFGRAVGYLPQDTELFAGTVRDNIARFRRDASDEQVVEAARLAGAHEMIVRLQNGYDTEVGEGGVTLSVGQRQRLGLARALFGDPVMVVLDEPNAALDGEGEIALRQALTALKARGVTLIIVAHNGATLRTADRLVLIKDGAVAMVGPRDEVLARIGQGSQPGPKPVEVPVQAAG